MDPYADGYRAFERGDGTLAVALWTPLAEGGDPRAQFGLGLIYETGLGAVASDGPATFAWYQRAAGGGFSPSQNNLELLYAEGRLVPRDPTRAVALWREAATAGFGPAQHNLALALASGSGTPRDAAEAAEWRERAEAQRRTSAEVGRAAQPGGEAAPVAGDGEARLERVSVPVPIVAISAGEERPAPATSAPPATPPATGAFYLQLASLHRREDAVREGRELTRRHSDLLAPWQPTLRAVDLGAKGVWHRVLFGPIEGQEQAEALCAQIRARAGACLVAPAPGEDDPG